MMEMNRRNFLQVSLAAGTLAAASNPALSQIMGSAAAKSSILQARARKS